MDSFKTKTQYFIFISAFLVAYSLFALPQNKNIEGVSPAKTKVIFAFDNKTKQLSGIILYDAMKGKYGEVLIQNYKNNAFFIGYINGEFEERRGEISPLKGSEIVILKDRNSDLYKDPNLGLWDKYNPNLGLWDKKYPGTDVFFKNWIVTKDPISVSFDYKEWPCKWYGYAEKNDKNYLVINVI